MSGKELRQLISKLTERIKLLEAEVDFWQKENAKCAKYVEELENALDAINDKIFEIKLLLEEIDDMDLANSVESVIIDIEDIIDEVIK